MQKTYVCRHISSNFLLFNDYCEITETQHLIVFLERYGYKPLDLHIKELAAPLIHCLDRNQFDGRTLVAVGEGGKKMLRAMVDIGLLPAQVANICVKWNREWAISGGNDYETDIDVWNFSGARLILVEDVIASGETIEAFASAVEARGGSVESVVCGLISSNSPLLADFRLKIYSGASVGVTPDAKLDPFWFPAIYSYRHMYFGEIEMPDIYQKMANNYFQGNIDGLRTAIANSRRRTPAR